MEIPRGFLMIPVMRGFIRYTDLTDGSGELADLELIHQTIAAADENQRSDNDAANALQENDV